LSESSSVTVELFGIPRQRAGRVEMSVPPGTVREVLRALERDCRRLELLENGRLAPHYLLSINGEQFISDLDQILGPGTRLLLLSADVGG
jgi:hypothetical protein